MNKEQPDIQTTSLAQAQITYLYQHKTLFFWSNILLATVLIVSFWKAAEFEHLQLLIWYGLILTLNIARYLIDNNLQLDEYSQKENLGSWSNRYVFLTTTMSTVWGIAGIVFFPNDFGNQSLLILLLLAVLLATIPILATSRLAYLTQIIVTLAPVTLLLLMEQSNPALLTAIGLILSAVTLTLVAQYIYNLFLKLQEAQQLLQAQANTDQLTQLANRRYFDRTFKSEWRRAMRDKTPISLLILDVDHFKKYNDSKGHQEGDECLKKLAQTFNTISRRPADFVARYGGEEFAILLPNTTLADATMLAQRLRKKIEELAIPHPLSDYGHVTVSIGASCCEPGWDFIDEENNEDKQVLFPAMLITSADNALYVAKELGRNQVSTQACGDHKMSVDLNQKKSIPEELVN